MASSYYQFNFKKEPDDSLRCLICLEVAIDPVQHMCGRLFCKECIEQCGDNPCPNCREEDPQYFPDTRGVRDINNLTVQCNNVKSGCKWVGTLGDLDDHIMNKCGYTEVDCPYMQCSVYVKRRDLDSHKKKCSKRNYACKRCGEWMVYDMKQVHGSVCRKKSVKCRNIGCSLTTERDRMDEHEGKCKYAEAACRYEYIGCTVIRRRKEIKQHEQDDTIHLQLALEELQTVQAQLCRKEDELEAMHEKAMNLEGRLEIARKEIQKLKLESGHEPAHERRRQSGRLPLESRVQNSSKMQQRPTNPSSEGSSCTIS